MRFTKIPLNTFNELQLNAGILLKDFDVETGTFADSDMLTATTGGLQVQVKPTFEDMGADIDNCPKNTMELKYKTDADEVTVGGTALNINADMLMLMLGAADKDVSTGKIAPRKDLKISDFTDLWWVGDLSNGGFVAVKIINALSTDGFSLKTTDKGKANCDFTLTGHVSIDAQDIIPVEFYIGDSESDALYIHLDRSAATIEAGKTLTLTAATTSGATVTYASTDTAVATVGSSTGVISAVAAGVCVITAKATKSGDSAIATCIVTVTPASQQGEG